MANERLTDKDEFTGTVADNFLFHTINPDDPTGNPAGTSFKVPYSKIKGSGSVVEDTGTDITFTAHTFWNNLAPLTSGALTLDFTGAEVGKIAWVWIDRYAPPITGAYKKSGEWSTTKMNIGKFAYVNGEATLTIEHEDYLAVPSFTVTPGNNENVLVGSPSSGAESYTWTFNTVDDEGTATALPAYNGTDNNFTHTGLTSGQQYFYYKKAIGNGFYTSDTATGNGTPTAAVQGFVANYQSPDNFMDFRTVFTASSILNIDIYLDDVLNASGITSETDAALNVDMGDTASHKIELRPADVNSLQGLAFNNGTEKDIIRDIEQWGSLKLGIGTSAFLGCFRGCTNLTISATDILDINTTSIANYFNGCTSLTTIPNITSWNFTGVTSFFRAWFNASSYNQDLNGIDTSSVTTFSECFEGATVFNGLLTGWDFSLATTLLEMFRSAKAFNQPIDLSTTGNVTTFGAMFNDADAFNQDISAIDITSATSIGNFILLNGNIFSQANYDLLLISIESQVALATPTLDGLTMRVDQNYTLGGAAQTAHDNLTGTYGWTLTDSGGI